ncbi:MAG: efflux RND transporter periplasmic adaptor subunit [Chloroflexi bacterium]|nr:efflux RND transporter periplasmic adaptor subunit [Chloroflexota bacterium]
MQKYSKPIFALAFVFALALLFFARQVGANPLRADVKASLVFSGTLEARQTRIAPQVGARVTAVRVKKGDAVNPGDTLLTLDDSTLQTTMREAESAVRAAQANLDQVKQVARAGELALAQAAVAQAQAELAAAQRALDDANRVLASPQELIAQMHVWEGKVEQAQGEIGAGQAAVANAKSQVEDAQKDQSTLGKFRLAAMRAQLEAAEATLAAAQANLAGSERILDLYRRMLKNLLDLQSAQHAAANQVQVAEVGLKVAQADLDIVLRAAQPEAVALAQAKLDAAQANLVLIQTQAKRYAITSPIKGIVVDRTIDPGETTRPGAAVLTIADPTELQMTLYVPIRDLKAVRVGQPATIRVPSLPGQSFSGKISFVSPEGEFKPANLYNSQERSEMVFAVRVTVPNTALDLKAGLPADAVLE